MEAKASTSTRLAGKDLLGYKFIVIFKHGKLMQVNDKAPEFALANEDGEKVSLKDYRGKNLVLFFFPKANTPG
jgi:peroxiredoxin